MVKLKTRRISVQFLTHFTPGRLVKDITYSWTLGGNRSLQPITFKLGAMMRKLCAGKAKKSEGRAINKCWNIVPKGCKLGSQIFSLGGPIQGHTVQQLLVIGADWILFYFSISAFTPNVNPFGLISTFAPIGMLDLGRTLTLTPSVKRALRGNYVFCMHS
jgi:hypothetical protein